MHRSRVPVTQWFWAAYLVTTHTPGMSALQLQRQLGLRRYETAWTMLHKLRKAMVRPDRDRRTLDILVGRDRRAPPVLPGVRRAGVWARVSLEGRKAAA